MTLKIIALIFILLILLPATNAEPFASQKSYYWGYTLIKINKTTFDFNIHESDVHTYSDKYPNIYGDGSIDKYSTVVFENLDHTDYALTSRSFQELDGSNYSTDNSTMIVVKGLKAAELTLNKSGFFLFDLRPTYSNKPTATISFKVKDSPSEFVTPTPIPTAISITPIPLPIDSNIVIVIDASGSTAGTDPTTGLTFMGLINANALKLIQNIGHKNMGVVSFGGVINKTYMLSLCDEANKTEFETFIREISPRGLDSLTNLNEGLQAVQEQLYSVGGTKEVIVLSDGIIPVEGFDSTKKTVIDMKNDGIKVHFVQVLIETKTLKEPNRLYNELAKAADENVIVLNPDERLSFPEPIESENPCSVPVQTPTITTPTQSITTPEQTPVSTKAVKEVKEPLNENRTSLLESIIDWLKSIFS